MLDLAGPHSAPQLSHDHVFRAVFGGADGAASLSPPLGAARLMQRTDARLVRGMSVAGPRPQRKGAGW